MSIRIFPGDCRNVLKTLPDESVHCVVTSPPYWGLRDYGTATWEGGDPACDHKADIGASASSGLNGSLAHKDGRVFTPYRCVCGKCGARRIDSQIGLEPSFTEYVETVRAVFAEVRRVLRKDGTLWLNLGDSYAGGQGGRGDSGRQFHINGGGGPASQKHDGVRIPRDVGTLKPKDLCGIPWRVALALQADGWYLRSDIIWSKPNPMPESVTDRPTKAHEYLFLLTKSERYFYDAETIREELAEASPIWGEAKSNQPGWSGNPNVRGEKGHALPANPAGRNRRSVWEIATAPYSEAHFATFPPALVEPCILAGCPHKACAKCGAPWVREVERDSTRSNVSPLSEKAIARANGTAPYRPNSRETGGVGGIITSKTLGFSPSCSCNADTVPGTVLDPFGGAGTTGLVADRLGRNAILIELNTDYAIMAERRLRNDAGMFAQVT